MITEQITENEVPAGKVYKESAIWLGTFLGGPLTAGYLLTENYKLFGEPEKIRETWIYAILSTIVLLSLIFFLPSAWIDKIPHFVIPLVYTCITQYIFQRNQLIHTTDHLKNGGEAFSLWRVFGIGLIGAVLLLIPIFIFSYLSVVI